MRSFFLTLAVASLSGLAMAQGPVPRPLVQLDSGLVGTLSGPSIGVDGLRVAVTYLDGGASGTNSIFVVVSEDGGLTFGAPVRVDTDTSGAQKLLQSDSCQVVGDTLYVVWRDARNGATNDDMVFSVSTDGGASFLTADVRLDDGAAGGNEVFDWRFAVSPSAAGDRLYVLMSSEVVAGNGSEEVFLASSQDGGQTWSAAVRVGGDDAGGVDTDAISLAAADLTVHVAWEDDAGTGGFDDVLYQKSVDGGATFLPAAIQLDSTDFAGAGDAASSSTTGLVVRSAGALVVAAWPEERSDPSNEELRLAISTDGGATWSPDFQLGGYTAGVDDIDALDLLLADGDVYATWDDDRDQAGYDKIYVAVSQDAGQSFVEAEVSGALGGSVPLLAGSGDKVVVGFLTELGLDDLAAASYTVNGGASWSPQIELSDNAGGFDADSGTIAFGTLPENFLFAFLYDALGANHLYATGFVLCDDTSVLVRNAGTNPASLGATEAILGADWTATVDLTTTGHAFAAVVGFASPANLVLPGGQTLLVDLTDPGGELLQLAIQGGPMPTFTERLPFDPIYCGFGLSVQALHFSGVTPFALSNALDVVVGGL